MYDPTENFRRIVQRVARFLEFNSVNRSAVHRLLYQTGWRMRVRLLFDARNIQRQFRLLISLCTFREVARLYHAYFRGNNLAVEVAAAYIISRNMQHLHVLRGVMSEYNELSELRRALLAESDSEGEENTLATSPREENTSRSRAGTAESTPNVDFVQSDVTQQPVRQPQEERDDRIGSAEVGEVASDAESSDGYISSASEYDDNDDTAVARGRPSGRLARSLLINYIEPYGHVMRAVSQQRYVGESSESSQEDSEEELDSSEPGNAISEPTTPSTSGNLSNGAEQVNAINADVEAGPIAAPARASVDAQVAENEPSTSGGIRRTRGSLLYEFYTEQVRTGADRGFHVIRDHNRMTYHQFDSQRLMDRRINEIIRREENGSEELSRIDSGVVGSYVEMIRDVPDAQLLRWFHSMSENPESGFYTEPDLYDLLERARDCFRGPMED